MRPSPETPFSQVAEGAWLQKGGEIKVRYGKKICTVTGTSGNVRSEHQADEPNLSIWGQTMHLVAIRRVERIRKAKDGFMIPFVTHSRCRIPLGPLMEKGQWERDGLAA